jgi:hypothetical protein
MKPTHVQYRDKLGILHTLRNIDPARMSVRDAQEAYASQLQWMDAMIRDYPDDRERAVQFKMVNAALEGISLSREDAEADHERNQEEVASSTKQELLDYFQQGLHEVHSTQIAAMDLFVVPSVTFDLLYAFIIVRLARRDLVWINVTSHPTAEWITHQLTEAFLWNEAPRYLIRDRD